MIDIETQEANLEHGSNRKPAYLDMSPYLYYTLTLALFVTEIVLSLTIDDLGPIFDFIGAFAVSSLSFTIPGILYLLSYKRYNKHKNRDLMMRAAALLFIIFGIL